MAEQQFTFRWLGVNGIEIAGQETLLAIDPFFTRPPFRRLWSGRVEPDREAILRHIRPYRNILVTHNHYDHVMDVAAIARETGADVYGSENTFNLMLAMGLAPARLHPVHAGERLSLNEFGIEVYAARHPKTPVDRFINGPLPEILDPPLRLFDYRMDECFSYRITVDGNSLLLGDAPIPADVLFIPPLDPIRIIHTSLPAIHPRLVVPVHWDDFFRPLLEPVRPALQPPYRFTQPFRPIDLDRFKRKVEQAFPGMRVLIPEIFLDYDLSKDDSE